jgi:NADPH-dependent ferric siderophore reductase
MVLQRELRERRTYTVRNEDKKARTVVIEHPNRPGWKLTSAAKPDETTPGAYRFRMDAQPQASATLTGPSTKYWCFLVVGWE